jgi:SAM-dependent methyltransferase
LRFAFPDEPSLGCGLREERVVSAEQSPRNDSVRAPSGNADYQWAQFDSEAYFQHYYGEPHADDDRVIRCAVEAMKQAPPIGAELDVVDVGTGPNLIPFFCAVPRARQLTAWDYAESNLAWLEAEMRRDMRPQWRHFWHVTREAYGPDYRLPQDPMPMLRAKSVVTQGSIFDLPERTWDAATMFFCAESITERQDEFEAACASYARCVKPGGALAAAFLVRSTGYVVAGRRFPVLPLSAESIEYVFMRHASGVRAVRIGIVEREIRSGYSGFTFLTAIAR